jgi:regulator of replication initiation timing
MTRRKFFSRKSLRSRGNKAGAVGVYIASFTNETASTTDAKKQSLASQVAYDSQTLTSFFQRKTFHFSLKIMSTPTNFNQPTTPNYGTPDGNNPKRLTTIMGVAIAALLGLCVFLLVSKYNTGKALESTTMELTQQKEAFTELDAKYNDAVTQLEQQKGINAELDAKINQQLADMESQKNQIAQLIREKKDYRSALASFERQKNEYLAQIDELKKQVGVLTETNTQLTAQTQQLTSSLNETQTKLQEESTAKAALVSEKTSLETERNQLSKKVDIASAIRVKNVNVKAVDVRSNGKERTKSKAKKVDKLNVCFTTEANEVVPAGEETFYLRIVDPTGAPLAIESLGSGVSQDKRKETEVRYTTTATCNYSNGETEVCGAWQPGQNFVKGKYSVEIYNKGYLVGTGAFNLK